MKNPSETRPQHSKSSARRLLRLERLEGRQLLSANPISFHSQDFGHDHFNDPHQLQQVRPGGPSLAQHQDHRSNPPAGRDFDLSRSMQLQRGGRTNHMNNDNRSSRDVGQGPKNQPLTVSSIDIVLTSFARQGDNPPPIQISRPTIVLPLQSATTVVTISIPATRSEPETVSTSALTQPPQDRPETSASDAAAGSVATAATFVHGQIADSTSATETLVSLTPRDTTIRDITPRPASDFASISSSQSNSIPDLPNEEFHRWLDDAEKLQHKYGELGRTLQVLAQGQSLDVDVPGNVPIQRPSSSQLPSTPASDWLNQLNNLLLEQTTASPTTQLIPSDIESNMTYVVNAGWTVGIGLFQSFETADLSNDIVMASAVASIDTAHWPIKSEQVTNEGPESSVYTTRRLLVVAGVAVTAIWHLRKRQNASYKNGRLVASSC